MAIASVMGVLGSFVVLGRVSGYEYRASEDGELDDSDDGFGVMVRKAHMDSFDDDDGTDIDYLGSDNDYGSVVDDLFDFDAGDLED